MVGLKTLLGVAGVALATQAGAQVTFYEGEGYLGRYLTANGPISDLSMYQFHDLASSANVASGRWEACSKPGFQGRCVILQQGNYPSLASMEMRRGISSVRPVGEARVEYQAPAAVVSPTVTVAPAPAITVAQAPATTYVNPGDQIYQARVTSVHPIGSATEQRCWMERQQVGPLELPGVLLNGTGDLLAGKPQSTPYVERCATVPGGTSSFDVTYEFQGTEHHAQMSTQPGATISVNGFGQPR